METSRATHCVSTRHRRPTWQTTAVVDTGLGRGDIVVPAPIVPLLLDGIGIACGSAKHQHVASPMPHPTDPPQAGHASVIPLFCPSSASDGIIPFQTAC
jgi:hypothetical protein